MKKELSFILLVFCLFSPVFCQAETSGDITMSAMEITGSTSFTLRNVMIISPELNGRFIVDFQWDPIVFGFIPISGVKEISALPPVQNIEGTYSFKSTVIQYSNGTTLTDNDFAATGTMTIGTNTMSQSLVINGTPVSMSGLYSLPYSTTFGNGSGFGVFHVSDSSGTHSLSASANGYDMIIYSGVITLNSSTTYEEYDTWTKTSEGPALQSFAHKMSSDRKNATYGEYIWIGNFLP